MSLWRLEWLRLVRSRRLVALVGIYLFLGLVGPVTARYLGEIVERFGSGVTVTFPDPVPADGIAQFTANANQLGLLVAIVVAAGALVIDAIPEMAIFLRTRVTPTWRLTTPRLVVSFAAIAVSFVTGLTAALYETVVLLGSVSATDVIVGGAYAIVYLAFVVALVGAAASRSGSVLATIAVSVVILLVLQVIGVMETVGRWLPSHLPGALDALLLGTAEWAEFIPATAVTLAVVAGLIALAARWADEREL